MSGKLWIKRLDAEDWKLVGDVAEMKAKGLEQPEIIECLDDIGRALYIGVRIPLTFMETEPCWYTFVIQQLSRIAKRLWERSHDRP